ncbi:MAG TPA: DUF4157 domain-containing protein [Trichocoleus sp.]|jgi:hypothetical protein
MKTQVPAKKPDSGVGRRSHLPTFSHVSPDAVSDSSTSADSEKSALHPDEYNLANIPIFAKPPGNNQRDITPGLTGKLPIQAKLTIGEPNDKYEQEADRVARQVVQQINTPRIAHPNQTKGIQRQVMPDMKDKLSPVHPLIQRKSSEGGIAATPELESSIQQAQGGGQLLPDSVRQPMEEAFGSDFSRVKVHADAQSDQLNRSIQASAFTTKQDIFFRQGMYNPSSQTGQKLIAHELGHVIQQQRAKISFGRRFTEGDIQVLQRMTWDRKDDNETIWSFDTGQKYEEFEGANIGGNYPIIDHYDKDNGVVTSLKTVDIVRNFIGDDGEKRLESTLDSFVNSLNEFRASNHMGVDIDVDNLKILRLKIAIPPKDKCPEDRYEQVYTWSDRIRKKYTPDKLKINNPTITRAKKQKNNDGEAKKQKKRKKVKMEILIDEREDLPWTDSPGIRYERRKEANIGGNYPVIDDFRRKSGVATSYKTMNIIENYSDKQAVRRQVNEYAYYLSFFEGGRWQVKQTHGVEKSLIEVEKEKTYINVDKDEIKERVLMICIPPVGRLLKENKLKKNKEKNTIEAKEAKKRISEKYKYLCSIDGKENEFYKNVICVVEEEE